MSGHVFIIAEAGVNHNGSLEMAHQLVESAHAAGADAVKFQTFRADALVSGAAPKAEYQMRTTDASESQLAMLRRLELDADAHVALMTHCVQLGIEFLSSPFDPDSVDLLERIGVRQFKLGSGELTNTPLLRHVGAKARPVILSTGMATLGEVETGLAALRDGGTDDVTLLHCVTEYPAPAEQINLRAMHTLHIAFRVPVGYSDHTDGTAVSIAAVALGAAMIEKHFTLDRALPGPDHRASLEPHAFARMVTDIRATGQAMGDGIKRPAECERANMPVARKSVVAARTLPAGRIIEAADLAIKRPGHGIAPGDLERVIGRRAAIDLARDDVLTWDLLQ